MHISSRDVRHRPVRPPRRRSSRRCPSTVVDSRSLGMAMGYAVLSAADARRRTVCGAEAVAAHARARCRGVDGGLLRRHAGAPAARRSHRLGVGVPRVGAGHQADPDLVDGHIRPLEKVRTSTPRAGPARGAGGGGGRPCAAGAEASTSPCTTSTRRAGPTPSPAGCARGSQPAREVRVVELGAVVGAHVGPGHHRGRRLARRRCREPLAAGLAGAVPSGPGDGRTGGLLGQALAGRGGRPSSSAAVNPATILARILGKDLRALGLRQPRRHQRRPGAGRPLGRRRRSARRRSRATSRSSWRSR